MRKYFFILLLSTSHLFYGQDKAPEVPDGYFNNTTLKISYFLGFLKLIEKEFPVPQDVVEHKDLVYKTVDSTHLKLDIYHQKNISKSAPLLIFIHGGGWRKGDKQDYLRYLVDFAQRGYVTASIQYRFINKVKMPAQIFDVKSAVIWLKDHAKDYHINPDQIAVIGGSAGGHLALMIGYSSNNSEFKKNEKSHNSSKVQAIVDFYGPMDLTTVYARNHSSVTKAFESSYQKNPEGYALASPMTYISPDDPPTLIFHGTLDELVPVEQSDRLEALLKESKIPVEYHRLTGWPHTLDASVEMNAYCQYYMNQFFQKYLHK